MPCLLLYTTQLVLFLTATGRLHSVADLGPVVPGRLSLLVDIGCILAELFVAYRAWGLVRSRRCARHWLLLSQLAVGAVLVGAFLDFMGDIRRWFLVDAPSADQASMTLTFGQAFWRAHASSGVPWYSVLVTVLTVGGVGTLLVQAVVVEIRNTDNQPPLAAPLKDERDGPIICCSGGGIRASAFSLGGLQVLQDEGIYQNASAVVGVSGGGYVAAAHHIIRWNIAPDGNSDQAWDLKPPGMAPFSLGSPETQWLRRHTRYVLDSLGAFTQGALSLAFGIAVNLLLVVVAIGGAAWLLAWLFLASGRLHTWDAQHPNAGIGHWFAADWAWVPTAVYVWPAAGIALFVLDKCIDRFGTPWVWLRNFLRKASHFLINTGAILVLLLIAVPWIVEITSEYAATSDSPYAALLHQAGLVPHAVCKSSLEINGVGCGLNRSDIKPQSPLAVGSASIVAVVSSILAVLASAKSAATSKDTGRGLLRGFLAKVWAKIKDPLVPYLAATIVVVVGVLFFLREITRLVVDAGMITAWNKALILAALLVFARLFTDANRTSMHYFFRERISEAFFVRRTESLVKPIDYKYPLRFSQAAPPRDDGPWLVSCAVANVSDQELVPSDRGCTPFVFGHSRMGLTDRLLPEGAARRVSSVYEFAADNFYRDATIPAAVAISGAAFSPLGARTFAWARTASFWHLAMPVSASGFRIRSGSTNPFLSNGC